MTWFEKFRYRLAKLIIHFIALKLSSAGTIDYCIKTAALVKQFEGEEDE
jgi:uncharacterized membrane protein